MARRDFTTGEIADSLGVAPRTVAKWVDSGVIRGYKLPLSADRRVSPEALSEFLVSRPAWLESLAAIRDDDRVDAGFRAVVASAVASIVAA